MKKETFKNIDGFDYQISNWGRVVSLPKYLWNGKVHYKSKMKLMIPIKSKNGYQSVVLHKGTIKKSAYIHRLVLETFIGPCPEGQECRHLDGNPSNNIIENLCWGTPTQNQNDRRKHGTDNGGFRHPMHKLKPEEIELLKYLSQHKIKKLILSKMFKINRSQEYRIRRGLSWK